MTQEEKDLLLRDLCERLYYRGKLDTPDGVYTLGNVDVNEGWINASYDVDEVKPYLRAMSDMTPEERYEVQEILGDDVEIIDDFINIIDSSRKRFSFLELKAVFDWFDARGFDYRGLIPMGLALKAPKDMYKK